MLCTEQTYWVSGTLTPSRLDSWTLFLEDGSPIGHVVRQGSHWTAMSSTGLPAGTRRHLGEAMDLIEISEEDDEIEVDSVADRWFWYNPIA